MRSAMTVPRNDGKQRPPQYWSTSGVACCAGVTASTFYGFILFSGALQCVLLCLLGSNFFYLFKEALHERSFQMKIDLKMI